MLIPDHLRRHCSRPVSYYALFKWWLLLSQHPGCHRTITSYRTKLYFGTLADAQGCFHLDRGHYRPPTYSRSTVQGIRSLIGASRRLTPRPHSVALPPMPTILTLTLKLFRRERAISQFDWTLTPPVSSSQTFSTVTRSTLQAALPALQSGQR